MRVFGYSYNNFLLLIYSIQNSQSLNSVLQSTGM